MVLFGKLGETFLGEKLKEHFLYNQFMWKKLNIRNAAKECLLSLKCFSKIFKILYISLFFLVNVGYCSSFSDKFSINIL